MNILSNIKVAFKSLNKNKLRSFLTMLGVVIGIGAVLTMIAIGNGAKAALKDQFNSLGSNLLYVIAGSTMRAGVMGGMQSITTLTDGDAQAIQKECPAVKLSSPSIRTQSQVVYGNKNWSTMMVGGNTNYPIIRNWPLQWGNFFTERDAKTASKVAVLGKLVAEKLFEEELPIGKIIRIEKIPFKVVGILTEKGQSSMGFDQDDIVIVPYTTLQKRIMGINYVTTIMVSAVSEDRMEEALGQITSLLRRKHRLAPGQEDDFMIRNMADISRTATSSLNIMALLLGSIATISLIVGGIGIMNIMLVSVTERTREIGIRMAVGAKERDILFQFLVEALTICIIGGLLGLALGYSASKLFSFILHWSTVVTPSSVVISIIFALSVGILFGYWPARRASKMNPIDALRYE